MRDNIVTTRKNIIIIYIAVFILCLIHFLTGCGDKNESPQKSVAVSKKIVPKKSPVSSSPEKAPAVIETKKSDDDSRAKVKTEKNVEINQQISLGESKKDDLVKQENSADKKIKDDKNTIIDSSTSALPPIQISKLQPEGITTYNPEGKNDPFVPLFKQGAAGRGKRLRAFRTPLEMVDLSQLKLVAIMRAKSGNKALVEESSGKGFVVEKGTYIGNNFGRIVNILNDRIIVEEEIENIIGEKKIQERELKLQKPLGEE